MVNLPEQFVSRMREMLGEEELRAFLSSYERPIARGLRINPLKLPQLQTDRADAAAVRKDAGRSGMRKEDTDTALETPAQNDVLTELVEHYGLRPVPWAAPYGFYYGEGLRPGRSPLHEAGLYYIQEPSAMAAAALSGVRPGEKVLDLCAAPGGKTTMLAAAMRGRGLLIANEIDAGRAKILSQNVERMGIPNALVVNESPEKLAERFPAFCDRVIVDAPCSGEGMFRREEQALAMWSPENVAACAARQAGILDCAAVMVKSGGTLVYSTCTFAPEEDEGSIAAFLDRHTEFSPVDVPALLGEDRMREWGFDTGRPQWAGAAGQCRGELAGTIRLWPHRLEGEGHYVAVLQKEGAWSAEEVPQGAGLRPVPSGARPGRNRPVSAVPPRRAGRGRRSGAGQSGQMPAVWESFFAEEVIADLPGRLARESGSGLVRFGDELWLMPYRDEIPQEGLRILRAGLHCGTVKKGRFEPAHALAMALHRGDAVRELDLDADAPEAAAFLRGESLPCDPALRGWTLVTIGGVCAGWGKASGGSLKNHYPRGLRRPY